MTYKPAQVAFVDIETTGLDPEHDAIWEIAIIVDDTPIVWQQALTDRQIENVHPKAAEITGFHERYDPTEATTPSSSIRRLMHLIGDRHMVGACPWFDSERLHRVILADIRRALPRELPWHYHLIDVENLAVGYLMGRAAAYGEMNEAYALGLEIGGWELMPLPWKSRELAAALGIDQDKLAFEWGDAHTALADAAWARAMFEAVFGEPEIEYR